MSFKSLNHILGSWENQRNWQEQPWQHVLKYWSEAVGVAVAAHTRPVSIQRHILWVATSSSVWAQELAFRRQSILEKLNAHLPSPLLDIRFSAAQWQSLRTSSLDFSQPAAKEPWHEHPSYVTTTPSLRRSRTPDTKNPKVAFGHWAKVMQARSQGLPLCPQCHCPTPEGELQRWAVCSICATKQW